MSSYTFGPFRLSTESRVLARDGKPLALGPRPFDILVRLLASAGEIVPKKELIASAWGEASANVEEGTLRVHIAALRRALGEGRGAQRFIANVPLRGYSFRAPVTSDDAAVTAVPSGPRVFPESVKRIFGRDEDIGRITALLRTERFVTLVGAGGVGKTTAALAAARLIASDLRDGARLVELATLVEPRLVAATLASLLDAGVVDDAIDDVLVGLLEDMEVLLVIDNCEHVVEAVAELVEKILRGTQGVRILATSREALRADGEILYRMPSLELASETMTPEEIFATPAVALLVERAVAIADDLEITDADAPVVAEIARRLDGIPLALELAAGLVPLFGLRGLAAHLDDRFALLTRGARTALPRQRTLRATFDWSYGLLAPEEQAFFRRLAVFRGPISAEAAGAVVACGASSIAVLAALVDKSLVAVHLADEPEFRLLESSKAYGASHLAADPEEEAAVQERHAEYFAALCANAEPQGHTSVTAQRLVRSIDDVRAALEWAFSPRGNVALGVALTIASGPLWNQVSFYEESIKACRRALSAIERAPETSSIEQTLRWRMKLHATMTSAIVLAGFPRSDTHAAVLAEHARKTLDIAEQIGDVDYKLRALWGMWVASYLASQHREGLLRANMFLREAERLGDATAAATGQRMAAIGLHVLGAHERALEQVDAFLAKTAPEARQPVRFTFDQRVTALAYKSRMQLVMGRFDAALVTLRAALSDRAALEHPPTMLYTLVYAGCPIALLLGDTVAAKAHIDALLRYGASRGAFRTWGCFFDGMLSIRQGDPAGGAAKIEAALAGSPVPDAAYAPNRALFASALTEAALARGDILEAERLADAALRLARELEEEWVVPELLRVEADVHLRRAGALDGPARSTYAASLALAASSGARLWTLCTATSLAKALRGEGAEAAARAVLEPALAGITGGDDTPLVMAAKAML